MRFADPKFRDCRPPQRLQVRAAAHSFSQVVRHRTHVGAGRDSCPERAAVSVDGKNLKFFDLHRYRIERDILLLAGQFIGPDTGDLLGRIKRRHLLDRPAKLSREFAQFRKIQRNVSLRSGRFAVRVIRIGRKPEADHAFIALLGMQVELRQPSQASSHHGQNSGGRRIEGSEVTDRLLPENPADSIYHIV